MLGVTDASFSHSKKVNKVDDGKKHSMFLYVAFFCALHLTKQAYRDLGICTCITLSASLQLLAYSLLLVKVLQQRSMSGVSAKALQCHALSYACRLSSTVWLKGYMPADSTAKWLYQALDITSLTIILCLLYFAFRRYKHTYQEELDTFDITYVLAGCLVLAVLLHPNLNKRPLFDILWTFALYLDMFTMLPQLWMVARVQVGAEMEALNAHYIAAYAASRAVSLYFWFYAFREFAPKNGDFNTKGWAIMGAHVIQLLMLADFVFFYAKACISGCVRAIRPGDAVQASGSTNSFEL